MHENLRAGISERSIAVVWLI